MGLRVPKWDDLEAGVRVQVKYPPVNPRSREDAERRCTYRMGVMVSARRAKMSNGAFVDIDRCDQLMVVVDDKNRPVKALR